MLSGVDIKRFGTSAEDIGLSKEAGQVRNPKPRLYGLYGES